MSLTLALCGHNEYAAFDTQFLAVNTLDIARCCLKTKWNNRGDDTQSL